MVDTFQFTREDQLYLTLRTNTDITATHADGDRRGKTHPRDPPRRAFGEQVSALPWRIQ